MDSNLGNCRNKIEAIKVTLLGGQLSPEEIERRLSATIKAELEKPFTEMDGDLVKECERILWELRSPVRYESNAQQRKEEMIARIKRDKAKKRRWLLPAACIAIVFAFTLVVADALFHFEWLHGESGNNQQQFIINGREIDAKFITDVTADSNAMTAQVDTRDLNEAVDLLGYLPPMPVWLPNNWIVDRYLVTILPTQSLFTCVYTNTKTEEKLRYGIKHFNNSEDALASFEQSAQGEKILINASRVVYLSINIDRPIAVWMDGLNCHHITGNLPRDEFITIINLIEEEGFNEE